MEKKQVIQTIANNIKSLLLKKSMQAVDLAHNCKISTTTISKIMNGNMGISVPMTITLAEGLGVEVEDILNGIIKKRSQEDAEKKIPANKNEFSVGILSINNKRITCIKDNTGNVLGNSELDGGLDLTGTSSNLLELIKESVYATQLNENSSSIKLKEINLNLVMQSYEFEETRKKFIYIAKKHFKDVVLMSDWQITYFAAFGEKQGISLITDKGVSLCYKNNDCLKKLGGWKFPIYDLGGENWLGLETIRHTIEAAEGYVPISKLARNVLAKFNGKIEKITETCFINDRDPDIYCFFTDLLLRSYFSKDSAAKEILERGFRLISRTIEKVDSLSENPLKIAISGSLTDIYKPFFKKERLIKVPNEMTKVNLLADFTKDYLIKHGLNHTKF